MSAPADAIRLLGVAGYFGERIVDEGRRLEAFVKEFAVIALGNEVGVDVELAVRIGVGKGVFRGVP